MSQTPTPWLVRAKASPPKSPAGTLLRRRLLQRLESESHLPLVVLRAPAGFGKTFLLSQWRERLLRSDTRVAWLTVEGRDEPETLVPYLGFALKMGGVELDDDSLMTPAYNVTDVNTQLGRLMRAIEDYEEPIVLVLDDLETIPGESVHSVLTPMLKMRPDNLKLCLAFRHNPGLALSRFDVRGDVLALEPEDLQFTRSEVVDWFGADLKRKLVDAIVTQTRGWPVALQLLRSGSQKLSLANVNKSGETRNVAAYLDEQLLHQLSENLSDFLRVTSILNPVNANTADYLREASDSQALMLELHERIEGLFSPLENGEDSFRLHPLVRDVLRKDLSERSPRYASLCRRAAEWKHRSGLWLDAMDYALEAGDPDYAAEIFESSTGVQDFPKEGMLRIRQALELLKDYELPGFPRVQLARSISLAKNGRIRAARKAYDLAKSASAGFTKDRPGGNDVALLVDSHIVELSLFEYGCAPDPNLLEGPGWDQVMAAIEQDPDLHSFILTLQCLSSIQQGDLAAGFRFGRTAIEEFLRIGSRYGELFIYVHFGMGEIARCRPAAAIQEYANAIQIARDSFPSDRNLKLISDIVLAEAYWEMGHYRNARQFVRQIAKEPRQPEAWFDLRMAADLTCAELITAESGLDKGLAYIQTASEHVRAQGLERLDAFLMATQCLLLHRSGQPLNLIAHAKRHLTDGLLDTQAKELTWREREIRSMVRVALAIALQDWTVALNDAKDLSRLGSELGLERLSLNGLVLKGRVLGSLNHVQEARTALREAVRLATPGQYLRPFIAEAKVLRPILESHSDFQDLTNEEMEFLGRLRDTLNRHSEKAHSSSLTPRELQIIELVAGGQSDKLIARHVGLTPHGVRYHLKNIYSKLGVSNRTQAASKARHSGYL